jgi:heme/copper-type cytochrome/quinol oxidase subunit 2
MKRHLRQDRAHWHAVLLAPLVLLFLFVADAPLLACPICFRVEENATTDGVLAAVAVLVSVTTVVLGAFGTFVVRFARREATTTQIPDSRSQIPD